MTNGTKGFSVVLNVLVVDGLGGVAALRERAPATAVVVFRTMTEPALGC